MGRQMGFDGHWSQLEAWIDDTGLWRPDGYLAYWHYAWRTFFFWAFWAGKASRLHVGRSLVHLHVALERSWLYGGVLYTRLAGE